MKTFSVPLLGCQVPLLLPFTFLSWLSRIKKSKQASKKQLLDLLGLVCFVFCSHSVYEQSKDECREQQQNEGESVENAVLYF